MSVIETCLGVSGSFEGGNGTPNWGLIAGDSDQQGISCGALQWNVGTGSLNPLIQKAKGYDGANPKFQAIYDLAAKPTPDALAWVRQRWIDPKSVKRGLTSEAKALWVEFLHTPGSIRAQQDLAQDILTSATNEIAKFLPFIPDASTNLRVQTFFFDVHVQQGSLSKKLKDGRRKPDPLTGLAGATPTRALDFAAAQGKTKTADVWRAALGAGDPLTSVLLHYAYERALLARPEYQWDTLSRRGTIACRMGYVHGTKFDFTQVLP